MHAIFSFLSVAIPRRCARRTVGVTALAVLLAALLWHPGSQAQAYPSKPVSLVLQYPVGGPSDILARIVAVHLYEKLGQPFVVDAKVGAGGTVGTAAVARAKPDGYTLLLSASGPLVISPWLYPTLAYDPLRDLVPVVQVASVPMVLQVNQDNPVRDVKQMLTELKANPGKWTYGSSGNGTPQHLSAALLESMADVQATHVPYRGQAPMATDLMGGQIDFAIDSMVSAMPNLTSGRLRPLAVTSTQRSALLPDVPTLAEAGVPGYESMAWYGLMAPAGTPKAIVDQLNQAVREVLDLPEVRAQIAKMGSLSVHGSPEQFGSFIQSEFDKWGRIVQTTGASVE